MTLSLIKEIDYANTTRFDIEALADNGQWQVVASGDKIGALREIRFSKPTTARMFRLSIHEASGEPNINEFQLFGD